MLVGGPGPHDVRLRRIRIGGFRVARHRLHGWSDDHYVGASRDPVVSWLGTLGVRVSVASVRAAGEHVHESDLVRRRLVVHPSVRPFHGVGIEAHRVDAWGGWVVRHAGKSVGALPESSHPAFVVHYYDGRVF